jgi:hypothetical protein
MPDYGNISFAPLKEIPTGKSPSINQNDFGDEFFLGFGKQIKSLIEVLRRRRANSPTHFLLHYSLGHGQHRDL